MLWLYSCRHYKHRGVIPTEYIKTAAEIVAILGFLGSMVKLFKDQKKTKEEAQKEQEKSKEGQKCLLRAEMLKIYYHNKDQKKIRQFELQNFLLMYQAYKALGGNSFIDEVYEAVTSWEIIT